MLKVFLGTATFSLACHPNVGVGYVRPVGVGSVYGVGGP